MNFCLKWVHMARYELILKLDGALWLRIISKPLLTPKTAMEGPKIQKESKIDASYGSGAHPYQNPLYEQTVGPHMKQHFQLVFGNSSTEGDGLKEAWSAHLGISREHNFGYMKHTTC